MQDCVRQRIVCSSNIDATVTTLSSTPRPPGFPGTQQVSVIDYLHRGKVYADSVHMQDVVVFVSPGDVEDVAYYAGRPAHTITLFQHNTRGKNQQRALHTQPTPARASHAANIALAFRA